MSTKTQNERILFGLKVKQLRQSLGLSFADLSQKARLSVSYLNEIEKGKKYPRGNKIEPLAAALGVTPEELTSLELSQNMAPVGELLQSNFLNELPLDLFGIELSKVAEIIANAPVRVGAFISTLLELSRNYALKEENFYFGALRAYLELNNNYFEDLEEAVSRFSQLYEIPQGRPVPEAVLRNILESRFGYTIEDGGLNAYPELQKLRSVFLAKDKKLLLNRSLTPMQRAFQYGKELGFEFLQLKERASTSSLLKGRVFEEVINHSKAIYFSVALHIPHDPFIADLNRFFSRPKWDGEAFLSIMKRYEATPEMFYHRLTNILPRFFEMSKMFFLRFTHSPEEDIFEIDKELHLSKRHHPHGNGLYEHYCRRWVALSLLKDLHHMQQEGKYVDNIVRAQRSRYLGTEDEYLCLTIARPAYPTPNLNVSVTIGILATPEAKARIAFFDDPAIQRREVNKTCERCAVRDCEERAAAPAVVNRREAMRNIQDCLSKLEASQ
ncbi:helix-turn-helix domain-containing protein [Phaeodactylibacter luteus]|uniref:Helix-turn-helix domain-containing protein n=1 Tax=Phaeodactylibacter luteus TaxID=1564516 RepID=A0A5C6RMJ4_9BACT|nr:XRE family transcriptional regulator [Phaeodactylibacter luteus]TXB63185.1 helix-turn-helix domain-containing protein [Phaeodactylibacter luteus]